MLLIALLAGCSREPGTAWSGYAEGDYDELVPVRGLLSQLAGPDAAPRAGGPGKFWGQPPGGVPLPPLRPVRRKAGRRWLMGAMAAVAAGAVAVIAGVGLAACCWPSRCGHPARARSRVCRCDERRRLGNLDACGLPVPGVPGHR